MAAIISTPSTAGNTGSQPATDDLGSEISFASVTGSGVTIALLTQVSFNFNIGTITNHSGAGFAALS